MRVWTANKQNLIRAMTDASLRNLSPNRQWGRRGILDWADDIAWTQHLTNSEDDADAVTTVQELIMHLDNDDIDMFEYIVSAGWGIPIPTLRQQLRVD